MAKYAWNFELKGYFLSLKFILQSSPGSTYLKDQGSSLLISEVMIL